MVESIKKLREICQKPVTFNSFYQRIMARRFSIYLVWLLIPFKVSGNLASFLMLLTGITASIFFTVGSYWFYVIGTLLLQLWFVLDHADGELARYWKKASTKGIFIDKLTHHIVHPLIFLGLSIGLYKQFNNPIMLILGAFTAYFLLLQDLINIDKVEAIRIASKIKTKNNKEEKLTLKNSLFTKVTSVVYKIPGLMNIVTISAILNILHFTFFFYAVTFPIMILLKLIYNLKIPEEQFK
ncbi:hypothetical protein CL617_03640 [archaeon]|nr:hypothetical protein [archaeon]